MIWLAPWVWIDDDEDRRHAAEELKRELTEGHVLYGRRVLPVARRVDQDDVLFFLPDSPQALAAVHLTYNGPELDPRWPETELYDSIGKWETRMNEDHSDWD